MHREHTELNAWAGGWAISRGTPAPVEIPGGYRIDVGLPGHRVRYLLPAFDRALVDGLHHPGTWLKICADAVPLDPRWRVEPPEYLMSAPLSGEGVVVDPAYRLEVVDDAASTEVRIMAGAEVAARGKAALTGEFAVIDQVETAPDHRRRGLGKSVMSALSEATTRRGATTGVLVATEDGRALYSRLGWTLVSPVTAAWLVEDY